MKRLAIFIGIACIIILFFNNCSTQDHFPVFQGAYLGQKPPGITPQVFAPGIVSTETYNETGCTFSIEGKEFYFTRSGGDLKTPTIFKSQFQDAKWIIPQKALFEGFGPHISPDGKFMMFSKYRMRDNNQRTVELWQMIRKKDKWAKPQYLGLGSRASISNSGTVYYIDRSNMEDRGAIAMQKYVSGEYQESESLNGGVNSPYYEAHPCIATDERFLIFDSNRPGGYGEGDLYICFRDKNGSWGNAINLGEKINSQGWDGYASISPDGKYLLYSSNKSGNYQLYWISIKRIEKLVQHGL